MDLSVVIPTYNERVSLEVLLPKIEEVFSMRRIDGEIVVVDDNSPDKTAEIARKFNKRYGNIRVIMRKNERDLATAWLEGFKLSKGKYIVCMDADLCHNPKEIPRMVKHLDEYDIVIGSRHIMPKAMEGKSWIANLASRIAQVVARTILGLKINDISHSFRAFKKSVFVDIKDDLSYTGNVFLVEFLYRAVKRGYRVGEVPIEYGKRIYGKPKLSIPLETIRFIFGVIALRLDDSR